MEIFINVTHYFEVNTVFTPGVRGRFDRFVGPVEIGTVGFSTIGVFDIIIMFVTATHSLSFRVAGLS